MGCLATIHGGLLAADVGVQHLQEQGKRLYPAARFFKVVALEDEDQIESNDKSVEDVVAKAQRCATSLTHTKNNSNRKLMRIDGQGTPVIYLAYPNILKSR